MSIITSKYRIHFPGAIYHVINRGNNKGDIFIDEKDYNVFLKHLREVKEEKDFFLYCYCLMPNHFHLLLEVNQEPLSKIMQSLLTSYVIYFNSRHERSGHLFQSRYKAVICDKEEYLFRLVRYIHLNPKRAHLVEDIDEYKWSSHNNYSGKWDNKVLSTEKLFMRMGETLSSGYRIYNNLVKDENDKSNVEIQNSYKNNFFGSKSFMKAIKSKIKTKQTEETEPEKEEIISDLTMDEILNKISKGQQVSKELILSDSQDRDISKARKTFYYEASKKYNYTIKEIASFMDKDYSGIAKYIREAETNGFKG